MSRSQGGGPDLLGELVGVLAQLPPQEIEQRLLQGEDEGCGLGGGVAANDALLGDLLEDGAGGSPFFGADLRELPALKPVLQRRDEALR